MSEHKFICGITCPARPEKKIIFDNRRITIRGVADDVGTSFGSCQVIFTDVYGMKRAAAKIVLKLLNLSNNNVTKTSLRRC